jgi:hypothetical protein
MSDSSAVDGAVFAALAEPVLAALLPDGVWRDVAPQGKSRFVVVSMPAHADEYMFDGEAYELFTFLIKAVDKNTSNATAKTAAARIRTLIDSLTGAVLDGYVIADAHRSERVAYSETDPDNADARWQHYGGLFEIMASPTS